MKEKENQKLIDSYDYLSNAASTHDCTGLIPSAPVSEAELESYEDVYQFLLYFAIFYFIFANSHIVSFQYILLYAKRNTGDTSVCMEKGTGIWTINASMSFGFSV